jgi:hypothetical protein
VPEAVYLRELLTWIWLLNEGSVDLHAIAQRTESDFLARVAIP